MQACDSFPRSQIGRFEEWLAGLLSVGLRIRIAIFVLFSIVNFFLVFAHVFWRDEALPLLIAINNPSIKDFFHAMRYEGTPALWHFILWLIARTTLLTPLAAQIIHFIVCESITLLVLFGLQVPFAYRVIILLQEPFVWNALNVRQYQLAGGLILLFACFYKTQWQHRKPALAITLGLLAQTCLHGTIIAFTLLMFVLLNDRKAKGKCFQPAYLFTCGSLVLALAQMVPPSDLMHGLKAWHLIPSCDRLLYVLITVARNVLLMRPMLIIGFLGIQLLICIKVFQKNGYKVCTSLLAIAFCFVAFTLIAYAKISGPRHYWLLTYEIIALLAILYVDSGVRSVRLWHLAFTALLLLVSLCTYGSIVLNEPLQLKSQSKNLALYLDRNYPSKTILSKSEVFEAPVRLYRKTHPPEFALGRQAYVSYTVWNDSSVDFVRNASSEHIHLSELRSDLDKTDAAILDAEPLLVVSGFELVNDEPESGWAEIAVNEHYRLELIEVFEHALNENYAIYIVKRTNRTAGVITR